MAEGFKRKIYLKIWKFLTWRVFPTWDYSYMFDMFHEYLQQMSKDTSKNKYSMNKKNTKHIAIAAELTDRIAKDRAFEEAYATQPVIEMWSTPYKEDDTFEELHTYCNEHPTKSKSRHRIEQELNIYYMEYFTRLIRQYSQEWWD